MGVQLIGEIQAKSLDPNPARNWPTTLRRSTNHDVFIDRGSRGVSRTHETIPENTPATQMP
jgi:hypothetical protein